MVVKSELITSLSLQLSDIPPKDVEYGVNSILRIMSDTLASGGCIEIRGFGSFNLRYRCSKRLTTLQMVKKLPQRLNTDLTLSRVRH